jgi:hypothetical protein
MALHKGENEYIYGLHDRGGERLLVENGVAKGWVLVTEAIGAEANETRPTDYSDLSGKGLGVIVRLNQSYGENGTIPREARYPDFAQRVANHVRDSKGCQIWLIGNEMNFAREQPRRERSNEPEPITPRRYAKCYRLCRDAIHRLPGHENDLVVVGAIGPWNNETKYDADPEGAYPANTNGDWIIYMRDILQAIGPRNCDAIAIHAYSHGYDPALVTSEEKMQSFPNRFYQFFTYKEQMQAIPNLMRQLPVYLTEANGDRDPAIPTPSDGQDKNINTWNKGNNGWVKAAYAEIDKWNRQPGNQQIRCMILFRWIQDNLGWSIENKPAVHEDLKEAMANNYRWNTEVTVPERPATTTTKPETEGPAVTIPPVTIPTSTGIQIQDISASLPTNPDVAAYPTRALNTIRRIIIHHTVTAPSVPVERVAGHQVNNLKLPGITYHFCTTDRGQAYLTQPLEVVSLHSSSASADSVGIGLIGNFMEQLPPDAQLSTTAALLAHVAKTLNLQLNEQTVIGRRELGGHQSPGDTWPQWKEPLIEAAQKLAGQEVAVITKPEPEPEPEKEPELPAYRTEFIRHTTPKTAVVGRDIPVSLTIRNTGQFTWARSGQQPFMLGFYWVNSSGQTVQIPNFTARAALPKDVATNDTVEVQATIRTPGQPGAYRLQWDMVHEYVTWFSQQGDQGLLVDGITINPAPQPEPQPEPEKPPVTVPAITLPATVQDIQIQNVINQLPSNPNVAAYPRRSRPAIRGFVIHHTVTGPNVTVERLAQHQVQSMGRPGLGFHFVVSATGEVYQAQPLEAVAPHADQHSDNSIGVLLIGNFSQNPPPEAQQQATAVLIAELSNTLRLTVNDQTVRGRIELSNIASPGVTWPQWKPAVVGIARGIQTGQVRVAAAPTPVVTTPTQPTPTQPVTYPKVIDHYMLFWHKAAGNWAEWDFVSAIDYVSQFAPTLGFSIEEAKCAKAVTIVGGPAGVPAGTEEILRAAGCQVERLSGRTQEETNQMLYDLVARNRRFRTLR